MQHYQRWNNIIGWIVGLAACAVYVLTAEATTSWWDCGEYISTAFKLQVGHPPGAPTFQLIGRIFSMFAFGDIMKVGFLVNCMSALCSGFSILFLFWSITMLGKKLVLKNGEMTMGKMIAIFGAGAVGAFAYTFSDSFWFSAVEGEVYAMSSFFTAITFWAILKWEAVADEPHHLRWIIFIAFMIGLAIGVHLLNLLVIPAVVFVVYYKKFPQTRKGFWYAVGLSGILLGTILWGIIPYTVSLSAKFDLFFVNNLGLPFNSGTIFYFLVLIGAIAWGIIYAIRKHKVILHTALLCFVFVLIGYSTFFILVIRSNAGVPINENEPKNALTLLSYLNRDQYGSRPLVQGEWWGAQAINSKEGKELYIRDDEAGNYRSLGRDVSYVYADKDMMMFPRMGAHESGGRPYGPYYKYWSGAKGDHRPTMAENIRFFLRYQVGWEYLRYFMWNFVGRQNNIQGLGYDGAGNRDVLKGNWISGINFIDEARLGPQTDLPYHIANNQARNTYYFLPLLLGLIGLYYHYKKDKKDSFVVFLLFFMTGAAIIMYLNQPSTEPRERDYATVGSFYAFAIWIGLGVMALADWISTFMKKKSLKTGVSIAVTAAALVAVPGLMACQNWDDHDRSNKKMARDFARNMLESCEKDGILITNGDNDTFPVWFCQEVENVRPDVRVINSALAGSYWHIIPLFKKVYDSDPLPFSLDIRQYGQGVNDIAALPQQAGGDYIELKDLLSRVLSVNGDLNSMRNLQCQLPTRRVKMTINKEELLKEGVFTEQELARAPEVISWEISPDFGNYLSRGSLAFLDIMGTNGWKRPIHFASPYAQRNVLPTPLYAQMEGTVHRLVPYVNEHAGVISRNDNGINLDKTYDLFMNKFTWGNIEQERTLVDPESLGTAQQARTQYVMLAQGLVAAGRNDSAIAILDKANELFPVKKIEYDQNAVFMVMVYAQAGNMEKANEQATMLINDFEKRLQYFQRFPRKFQRGLEPEVQECLTVFYTLRQQIFADGKNPEIAARLDKLLEGHI